MNNFTVKPRPESARTESAPPAPQGPAECTRRTPLSRFAARLGRAGRRTAVAVAACAVLVGVSAAGQATGTDLANVSQSSLQDHATSTNPLPKLEFEPVRVAEPVDLAPAPAPAEIPAPLATEADVAAAPDSPINESEASEPAAPAAAPPAPAAAPPAPEPTPVPAPAPAPVAVDDPAGAQAYAAAQLGSYGWGAGQMPCLQTLWTKESDWRTTATNPSSGAYGIVQSLPAEKMASAGADFRTNYRTQVNWGLTYIQQRYGSPCGALNFHYANNWY